jgi:hypothetical protein
MPDRFHIMIHAPWKIKMHSVPVESSGSHAVFANRVYAKSVTAPLLAVVTARAYFARTPRV